MSLSMWYLKEYFKACRNLPWNNSTTLIAIDLIEPLYDKYAEPYYRVLYLNDCCVSLFDTIDSLNRLADQCFLSYYGMFKDWKWEAEKEINDSQELERLFINSFIPQLQRFVTVQNLQQLYDKDKSLLQNEILAAFLAFLLQILDSEGAIWFRYRKKLHLNLQKNVTFLLTILGDKLLWCPETGDVENLLVEFKSLANAAWYFVYSSTFASSKKKRKKNFDAGIHALLGKMDTFLIENLAHYIKLAQLSKTTGNPKSSPVHSPFIIDSLLEDLESLMNEQFTVTIMDIEDQIKTLIEELAAVRTVLMGIQKPQVTHNNELKESTAQIREMAHEAEYLIKTYVVESLPTWYLNLRLPNIVQKVKINSSGLQEIIKRLNVKDVNNNFSFSRGVSREAVKDSVVMDEGTVIGFEHNRTKILADLVGGYKDLKTIFIHGMPGIGKTTIAKKMFNDHLVFYYFDLRAWCVISQTYEKRKVFNDILLSLGSKLGKDNILRLDEENLGLEIYQSLKGRRYLIVVDDVWYSGTWNDMRRYFPDDGNGSRIILTSRVKDTAPPDSIFYAPPFLSESQCCDLLMKKVFIKESCPPELLGIAKGIASKCHGLPLAIVVVSGILANLGKEKRAWKTVEANLNSYMFDNQSKYMKILELCYEHLPDHLKPCFLYLGRFDEDEDISMWKVIPLWIAEGFVHKKEKKSLEQVAQEYYSDLVNRSLLMITKRKSNGGIKSCSIHDLLREMCLKKAVEEKFLKQMNESSIYEQHSHLVLHMARGYTFCALHCRSLSGNLLSLGYNLTKMPLLRVIDGLELKPFSMYGMERIWSLVHLKYLSISAPKFPIELYRLVNLEYFRLDIDSIVSVPANILSMVKLRHIRISTEAVFEKSCDSNKTMNNLKSLSYVLIRNGEEDEILRCSPHLHKLKYVCDGSLFPDLKNLTELESLTLKFTSPIKGELTGCCFPSTLRSLSLCGTSLPWEKMTIVGSIPNLHVLKLLRCAFVGDEWNMTYGEFEQLRFLRLEDLNLKQWITNNEHLPRLQSLVLESIKNLMEIPSDLGEIPTLERLEICNCSYEIERSVIQIEDEQRDYGNEDLKVIITNGKRLDRADIALVMTQAGVSRTRAARALESADGDIIDAMIKLTE